MNFLKVFYLSFTYITFTISCDDISSNTTQNNFLKINEIVASEANNLNDWIELHNTGNESIQLNDFSIMDSTSSQPTNLPNKTLAAGEYFVIEANSDSDSQDILPFGLGSEDAIYLIQNNSIIDSLSWRDGDAPKGSSYGLFNTTAQTLYPTKAFKNTLNQLFFNDQVAEMTLKINKTQWDTLLAHSLDSDYQTSSVIYNGVEVENIGLKFKGQQSIEFQNTLPDDDSRANRFNFKLDINKFVSGQKLFGAKKVILNNGFNDPSFMRDVLSYQLMNEIGITAPRTSYIDLSLNIDGVTEHLGLYYMVEAIDGEFIERHYPEEKSDTGDLYQAIDNATLSFVSINFIDYESFYELENNDSSINTSDYGHAFINMIMSLNQPTATLDYFDTDQVIKYLAINTVIGALDNLSAKNPNDYYLYEQRLNANKFHILPWDYNLAFGSYQNECYNISHLIGTPTQNDINNYKLINAIMLDANLKDQYLLEVSNIVNTFFNELYMQPKIEKIRDLVAPIIHTSPSLFYSEQTWQDSLTQTVDISPSVTTGDVTSTQVIGLLQYIRLRSENILSQLDNTNSSTTNTSVCEIGL